MEAGDSDGSVRLGIALPSMGGAFRGWLLRAAAGSPADLQIMYGVAGERWLAEREVPWLGGYENSKPVRIGNAASDQLQLDVFGEVMDAAYQWRVGSGLPPLAAGWDFLRVLLAHLETVWRGPDEGIWEVRSGRHQFSYSKVMAWVAFDRAIRSRRPGRPMAADPRGDPRGGLPAGVQHGSWLVRPEVRQRHRLLRRANSDDELEGPARLPG
jgi:Glycosyl hydrolases family 15